MEELPASPRLSTNYSDTTGASLPVFVVNDLGVRLASSFD